MRLYPQSDARMRRFIYSMLGTAVLLVASGCSHAMYSAANIPGEYVAPHHVSAKHIDFSQMQRNSVPTEWLQAGDSLEITIATGLETGSPAKQPGRIDEAGNVDVSLIGSVPVAGLTPTVAAERIRDQSIQRGVYVNPNVTVTIAEKRTYSVSVVGAVNEPDTYEIPASNCDLLTALTKAKGVSDEASRFIEIRHSPGALEQLAKKPPPVGPEGVALASYQPTSLPPVVNLDLAELQSTPPAMLQLLDGSVINVTREPSRTISVMGLVNRPQKVEMPAGEDITVLEAIAEAGGTTISLADKVQIVRSSESSPTPIVIEVSLADARSGGPDNMRLAPGDIVSVKETPTTMALQTIRSFFRVGFSAAVPGL